MSNAPARKRYIRGGHKAASRLARLGYDPILELVHTIKQLKRQLKYHEQVQDGRLKIMNQNKRMRGYNAKDHMDVFNQLIKCQNELIKYGYSKMPEHIENDDKPPIPLVINTGQSSGGVYEVNQQQPIDDEPQNDGDYFEDIEIPIDESPIEIDPSMIQLTPVKVVEYKG